MGILHSISRFLGSKQEDEEGKSPIYPVSLHRRRNHYNPYGHSSRSSERSPKILNFGSLIYNTIKGLLQRVCSTFYLPWLRKTADPVLPIQNPASSISNEPLLVQTPLISSPGDDSSADSIPESGSATFAFVADLNTDDQESQFDNADALSSKHWPEENYLANREQKDHLTVSIPDITCSFAYASASEEILCSAVFIEENAPKNDPFLEESPGINSKERAVEEEREEEKVKVKIKRKEEREEEEKVKIKRIIVVDEGRWIKHYNSRHRILLVGEGDFSFSACLAVAFGSASYMIATSLDSKAFLEKNYRRAPSNIEELRGRECKVMHGIDVTKMANHALLGQLKFDRIIYNFPHAGFFPDLPRESQLRLHQTLVSLFLKNAREMISENGEIHISHKINGFHREWKLESLASSQKLRLIEAIRFNHLDYPGYNTKYGFGGDKNFNCNPSKTYKFGLQSAWY